MAISLDCPLVISHKKATALAAAENIPVFEAKKRIAQGALPRGSPTEARFDYVGFPSVSRMRDSVGYSKGHASSNEYLFNSITHRNRFDVLGGSSAVTDAAPSYARVAAGCSSSMSSRRRNELQDQHEGSHVSRGRIHLGSRDLHILHPNGRSPSPSGNAVIFAQSTQDHTAGPPSQFDVSILGSFCREFIAFATSELLPLLLRRDVQAVIGNSVTFIMNYIASNCLPANLPAPCSALDDCSLRGNDCVFSQGEHSSHDL